jgi:hypothetical protein
MGEFPDKLDLNAVPPEYRKKGPDWYAISNPEAGGSFDVRLVHILAHERCVHALARTHVGLRTFIAASCVAFDSPRMAGFSLREATDSRRYTTSIRVGRSGEHPYRLSFIYFPGANDCN